MIEHNIYHLKLDEMMNHLRFKIYEYINKQILNLSLLRLLIVKNNIKIKFYFKYLF